jgi:large subunit ribosomal protein L31
MSNPTTVKAKAEGHHPKQHKVTVKMTDGSTFEILTTWGKEGDILTLDADPKNHPAWQEKAQNLINSNNERVNKFNQKFGGFGNIVKNN